MGVGRARIDGFAVVAEHGSVAVRSDCPTVELPADQARRLAICLLEAAQDAERPEPPEWP